MDMLLTEIVLWAGLLFIFWVMKDTLGKLESDIAARKVTESRQRSLALNSEYALLDEATEVIGHYQDAEIYRYVIIERERYTFDHIQLRDDVDFLPENKRRVAPGLIYVRCDSVSECVA